MLSGLMSAEDEEEIMKELDDLREQEVIYFPSKASSFKSKQYIYGNIELKEANMECLIIVKCPAT
jgi:hypothetical protein